MIYMGIDPGQKGAFAIISAAKIEVWPMDKKNLIEICRYAAPFEVRCCLEKVHAMPKQGVRSMFTFGEGYGYLKGVLESFEISYQEIQPRKWKAEFELNTDKAASIEIARQLFPDVNLIPEGCRKPSDGMAEALLMAEYARRKL